MSNKVSEEPLISVIVPVYNVERYLDQCVKSIVEQSYRNLEIILVDDGSRDACPGKCDMWAAIASASFIKRTEDCLPRVMPDLTRRGEIVSLSWTATTGSTQTCCVPCGSGCRNNMKLTW